MSQTSPFSAMQSVLEILDDIIMRRAARALTEKDNLALKEFIGRLILTQRLNMVRTGSDATSLWDEIRANEAVADFVLNVAVELQVWLDMSGLTFEKLISILATAYGQNHAKAAGSVIEKDLHDRLPKANDLTVMYGANPWLVGLLLISIRGIAVLAHIPNVSRTNPPSQP